MAEVRACSTKDENCSDPLRSASPRVFPSRLTAIVSRTITIAITATSSTRVNPDVRHLDRAIPRTMDINKIGAEKLRCPQKNRLSITQHGLRHKAANVTIPSTDRSSLNR
ncbi:hypothetical protein HAHE_24160 [Haloferula helveola]|uniref:Uncharacterized protein n=1 Tax=Haloferula helveola TaxID=490095 RepID=A0ABN6H5T6_9BACT|nr:hypothetical protein HAHE_24160 [Haloferula helveola]